MIGQDKISRDPEIEPRLRRPLDQIIGQLAMARRTLASSVATVGNTAATETELLSYFLPADKLQALGDEVVVEAAGQIAGTAAVDKRIKVMLGGTAVFDSGLLAIVAATDWSLVSHIARTGQNTQRCATTLVTSSSVLVATTQYFAGTKDLATDLELVVTGSGTNANDVTLLMGKVFKVFSLRGRT